VIVSQLVLFELALQAHVGPALTVNEPVPPAALIVWPAGEMENVQAASCVAVNVCPPMSSIPVRAAPVFAAVVKAIEPLPVPAAGLVIVSHCGSLEDAVHPQAGPAVTVTVPEPPPAAKFWLVGASAKVHAACCVTVSVWPPIVTDPLRAAPLFAATAICTVPFAAPDAPAVMVIHASVVEAVQAQPAPAVTAISNVPPGACESTAVGKIEKVHGAALCVTVNVWPAIVAVPVRAAPVLAATFSVTALPPVPEPLTMVIQAALLADAQPQDAPVETVTVEVPPADGIVALAGLIE
jgi:hypothetical protein